MLPEIEQVKNILMKRIAGKWPAVTFAWIIVEILICGAIWLKWRAGVRVYMQKDEGGSNWPWSKANETNEV